MDLNVVEVSIIGLLEIVVGLLELVGTICDKGLLLLELVGFNDLAIGLL